MQNNSIIEGKMDRCDINQNYRKALFAGGLAVIVYSAYSLILLYRSDDVVLLSALPFFLLVLVGDIMCSWHLMCFFKKSWLAKTFLAVITVPFLFLVVLFINISLK